jgi:hypothetical protein
MSGGHGLGAVLVAALVLSACGGAGSAAKGSTTSTEKPRPSVEGSTTSTVEGSTTTSVTGSTASFDVGGNVDSVTVTGAPFSSHTYSDAPQLNYSGPEGCTGQAFSGDDIFFRYSALDAYMVRGSDVYHFVSAPQLQSGDLVWDHTFGTLQIVVRIGCPPPRQSGPLLPPSY